MLKHQHGRYDQDLSCQAVCAAKRLASKLRKVREMFEGSELNRIDKTIRCLESTDFANPDQESEFAVLKKLISTSVLQEVVGVSTTLEEVYSDPGTIEYELTSSPVFTTKGQELKRVEEALFDFMQLREDLIVIWDADQAFAHARRL